VVRYHVIQRLTLDIKARVCKIDEEPTKLEAALGGLVAQPIAAAETDEGERFVRRALQHLWDNNFKMITVKSAHRHAAVRPRSGSGR